MKKKHDDDTLTCVRYINYLLTFNSLLQSHCTDNYTISPQNVNNLSDLDVVAYTIHRQTSAADSSLN